MSSILSSPVLLHTATANGFQMVTSGAQSKAISDWAITSLEVRHKDLTLVCSHLIRLLVWEGPSQGFLKPSHPTTTVENINGVAGSISLMSY